MGEKDLQEGITLWLIKPGVFKKAGKNMSKGNDDCLSLYSL